MRIYSTLRRVFRPAAKGSSRLGSLFTFLEPAVVHDVLSIKVTIYIVLSKLMHFIKINIPRVLMFFTLLLAYY